MRPGADANRIQLLGDDGDGGRARLPERRRSTCVFEGDGVIDQVSGGRGRSPLSAGTRQAC